MKKISATTRVQVTVEVSAGSYGGECQLDQLYDQAHREGMEKVQRLIGAHGRVVDAKVIGVLTEVER